MPQVKLKKKPVPPVWAPWVARLDALFPRNGQFIKPLSEDWRQARRGRLTASERALVIAERSPALWNALLDTINVELSDDYQWTENTAPALEWGRTHESAAIANIELLHGEELTEPGLVFHPDFPFVAATPDAMGDGGNVSIQIKCPYNPRNHLQMLYEKSLRPIYYHQVQWEAWVTNAAVSKFYSYDPRQPLATQLVELTIPVNAELLDKFRAGVQDFAAMLVEGRRLGTGTVSPMSIPTLF